MKFHTTINIDNSGDVIYFTPVDFDRCGSDYSWVNQTLRGEVNQRNLKAPNSPVERGCYVGFFEVIEIPDNDFVVDLQEIVPFWEYTDDE